MTRVRTRLTATVAAGAVLFASIAAFGASPAAAAPGDAQAIGASATVEVALVNQTAVAITGILGETSAPPSSSVTVADVSLGALPAAALQVDAISSSATSNAAGASATTEVTGARLTVPLVDAVIGGPLLDTGANVIRTTVDCPVGGTPTADFGPTAALRVAGQPVTLDINGEATGSVTVLGAPVGTVSLRTDVSTVTGTDATAAALVATVDVDLLAIGQVEGEVRIAEASCTAPALAAPTATGIDPDQGPVAGGTDVTVDGTGFIPGATTIDIGGNNIPADQVTVNTDGTSLTFTTPAHPAGPVQVTATTDGGTTAPLGFTYIGDGSTAPTADTIDPDLGPTDGGTVVIIGGTGFVPGDTTVTIGDTIIPADAVTVTDDGTSLTFTTPPHAEGPVQVTVTTPGGTTGPLEFTYVADTGPTNPTGPTGPTGPTNPAGPTNPSGPGNGGPSSGGPGNGGPGSGAPGRGAGGSGPSDPNSLPRTGSNTGLATLTGTLLVLAGGSLLRIRRRIA